MDEAAFEKAVAELRAHRDRIVRLAIEKADQEFESQRAALRMMLDLGWRVTPPSSRPPLPRAIPASELGDPENEVPDGDGRPSLKGAVLHVIDEQQGDFTVADVERRLNQLWPGMMDASRRASLSSTLINLKRDHAVQVVEVGRGSRPTIYRRGTGKPDQQSEQSAEDSSPLALAL